MKKKEGRESRREKGGKESEQIKNRKK